MEKSLKEMKAFIIDTLFFPFTVIFSLLIVLNLYFITLHEYNSKLTFFYILKYVLLGLLIIATSLIIIYLGYKLWWKNQNKIIAIHAFFILKRKRKKSFLEFLHIVRHDKKLQNYLLNYYKIKNRFNNSLYGKYSKLSQKKLNKALTDSLRIQAFTRVKYLLTSPRLSKHANIHYKNDQLFIESCMFGHLDLVKYLLFSPELKEHSLPTANNNQAFKVAYLNERIDIIRYFLYDLNIEITKDLEEYIKAKEFPNHEINFLIEKRELYNQLNKDITKSSNKNKRMKI